MTSSNTSPYSISAMYLKFLSSYLIARNIYVLVFACVVIFEPKSCVLIVHWTAVLFYLKMSLTFINASRS